MFTNSTLQCTLYGKSFGLILQDFKFDTNLFTFWAKQLTYHLDPIKAMVVLVFTSKGAFVDCVPPNRSLRYSSETISWQFWQKILSLTANPKQFSFNIDEYNPWNSGTLPYSAFLLLFQGDPFSSHWQTSGPNVSFNSYPDHPPRAFAQKIFPAPGHLTVNFSPAPGALYNIRSFSLYSYWEYGIFSVPGPRAFARKISPAPGHLCKQFLLTPGLPGGDGQSRNWTRHNIGLYPSSLRPLTLP